MKVGIFELESLSPGRWRVLNTSTQIPYVTYGTEEEVVEILQAATAAWERRTGSKKTTWRDQMKLPLKIS